MLDAMRMWVLFAVTSGLALLMSARLAHGQEDTSPLQVVMDGRAAAEDSRITEQGLINLSQSGTHAVLFASGMMGIVLTSLGVYRLWSVQADPRGQATTAQGLWMVGLGGVLTIPAVIAAVVPFWIVGNN